MVMRWIRKGQRALTGIAPHNANPAPAALVPIKRNPAWPENPLMGDLTIGHNAGLTYYGFFAGGGAFGSWTGGHMYQLAAQTTNQISVILQPRLQVAPSTVYISDELSAGAELALPWSPGLQGYARIDAAYAARWIAADGQTIRVRIRW